MTVERLTRPNRETLIKAINAFRPHVLHFMGHARFEERGGGGGALALVDPETREPIWLNASETDILFQNWRPHAMVIVACEGGNDSLTSGVSSLARTVVSKNIQVVSMRFKLSNQIAMAFTREFYQRLAAGEPLDSATQAARRMLIGADVKKTTRDFGGVVLYMRTPNGIILPTVGVPSSTPSGTGPQGSIETKETTEEAIAKYKRKVNAAWHAKWNEQETHDDFKKDAPKSE
jgi:CHAT domain-containing protein